ncbi:MAG TPA: hypothetical protein VMS76_18600 [Planctomycetota bacterium]|nr:hypothetical protein [Planctomycetota bacterium]
MSTSTLLERRMERLERRLRFFQGALLLGLAGLVAYACAGLPHTQPGGAASDLLRVRGLILVDEQGRERIAIGAPWPSLGGRASQAQGVGMLIVDEAGVDRISVAAPAPDPPGGGKRIATANGMTWFDQQGKERGGVGYLDNGRSLLVLDNKEGEGAGVFAFDSGYVGMGLMRRGQFRALMEFDPATGTSGLVLSDDQGRPRVRFSVPSSGMPAWELLDEEGDVLPP